MKEKVLKKSNRKASRDELFTGGKFPEFTVFYNIAFFRVAGLLNHLLNNSYELDKNKLETVYAQYLKESRSGKDKLPDDAYSKLRRYLWKGYLTEKNSSGYELTDSDKSTIQEMLWKLLQIRNFQSHYWHDNSELEFSKGLKEFICQLHETAKLSLSEKYAQQLPDYDKNYRDRPFFFNVDGKEFITQEGRTFFLSFFLTKGEMARFLQLRKGSKRNDKPEYKVKHEVYRYYTHREGASKQYFGFEENVLNDLPINEQKEVLSARQAFKLITYLNDIPSISNDPKLFPLLTNDGRPIATANEIIAWCHDNNFLAHLSMKQLVKSVEKRGKGKAERIEVTKEKVIEISLPDRPSYFIYVGIKTMHRLIIDSIRKENSGNEILNKLNQFIDEREYLVEKLKSKDVLENETGKLTLTSELDEYYRYKLRSGDKLRKRMGRWLDQFEKTDSKKYDDVLADFIDEILNAPIEVNYYDFSFEEDIKPRAKDRFTEFAVQYLIDFGLTPDWEWMTEKFDTVPEKKEVLIYDQKVTVEKQVNKRILSFHTTIPKGHRLSIKNDQILVRDKNKPDTKFLLGKRALKNLLAASVLTKPINHFFKPVIADLEKIGKPENQFDFNNLNVLSKNELPPSIFQKPGSTENEQTKLIEKAKKRIDYIINELKPFYDNSTEGKSLSRAEKNRQIMRCYKYFDWRYPQDGKFKFLRKDEYQRMSVYHYLLENMKSVRDRDRYKFLLKEISPHLPNEIKEIVKGSNNLNELLANICSETTKLLNDWKNKLSVADENVREAIFSKIGIARQGDSWEENKHIPFDIHPILPLRVFFSKEDIASFSLSNEIRNNPLMTDGLKKSHYHYQPYLDNYLRGEKSKQIQRKLIGKINALYTEDALLWFVARKYLESTNPAIRDIAGSQLQAGAGNHMSVGSLRQIAIPMVLEVSPIGRVIVQLKFHQLDDYLLVESKPVIARAVKQLLFRYNTEEKRDKIITRDTENNYVIPYEEIFKEIQRVYYQSYRWASYLLNWEKSVIEKTGKSEKEKLGQVKIDDGKLAHINFNEVLQLATLGQNDPSSGILWKIRNKAFHAEIPGDWSYEQMEENEELCRLIGYEKKKLKEYGAA